MGCEELAQQYCTGFKPTDFSVMNFPFQLTWSKYLPAMFFSNDSFLDLNELSS